MEESLEQDLDPRSADEWEAVRRAGYRLVDLLVSSHQGLRHQPCWQKVPPSVRGELREPPPREGLGIEAALDRAERLVYPYPTGNRHPRFWGWVKGAGTLPGILGQWMAAAMNCNVWGGDQAAAYLERAVLSWFLEAFEFPETASALLVDGASMANVIGLAVARHAATKGTVKARGLAGLPGLRVYCSSATHNSIVKAAELLGLGSESVCFIETDASDRVDVGAMERAISADRVAGATPCCVVGNAGTVGTGAIDALDALRDLSDRHGLWFHVDGAVGALGFLSSGLRPRLSGLQRADSLAFDFHKWGQVPYDAGCVLVRDGQLHRDTFTVHAAYLSAVSGGLSPRTGSFFGSLTPQLSRGDRALKIWMTFMALGTDRITRVFDDNVAAATHLAAHIQSEPDLELLAPVALNIVCWRYRGRGPEGGALDALNERILVELQESGFCVLSPYRVRGRFCLRAAICNHRTRREDVEAVASRVRDLGRLFEAP